jgi:serine-type D-Ala-D-Ala endopeptidase (penicillin-binding protein 7)
VNLALATEARQPVRPGEKREDELRLIAVCALGLALACVAGTPAVAQSTASAKATATGAARVQGSIPAGKARIQSTRSKKSTTRRPFRPSEGQLAGLHRADDALDLKSSVALVVNQDTDEVLFEKNTHAVLPLDEELTVSQSELVRAGVRSNLRPGMKMTRDTALHLALMSSENRAAQLLGRTYPGGLDAFVEAMNAKARMLDMSDSHFADPTGLSPDNRSSANDLVKLVKAAYEHDVIREHSVSGELALPVGKRMVRYGNTNRLTANPEWDIGLQKTGYISAAGRCLVMQAVVEGQRVVMVLLDSVGKYSRIGDAQRIRDWLASKAMSGERTTPAVKPVANVPGAAKPI